MEISPYVTDFFPEMGVFLACATEENYLFLEIKYPSTQQRRTGIPQGKAF
jgi:hypothetical protein